MYQTIVSVSRVVAATFLVACASIAFAQATDQAPAADAPHRHGPSPEAIAACASKAANDTCSFTAHRGTITGQCVTPRMKPATDTNGGGTGAGSTSAASGGAGGATGGNSTAANGGAGSTSAAAGSGKAAQLVCRPDRAAGHAHDSGGSN